MVQINLQRKLKKYPKSLLNGDMELFVTDWHSEDAEDEDEGDGSEISQSSSEYVPRTFDNKFLIKAFCVDSLGNSVAVDIENFKPYFFIKVPDTWKQGTASTFIKELKDKISRYFRETLVDWKLLNAKPFYYFTGDERYKFKFIKMVFQCHRGYKQFEKILKEKIKIHGINKSKPYLYERYESNILPLLRFIHHNDLNATGWISIPHGKYTVIYNKTTCQTQIKCKHQHVKPLDKEEIPPINYMSYDIEADSSHGDFPIANKDYQKLARDLITEYNRLSDDHSRLRGAKPRNIFDTRKILYNLMLLAFNPYFNNNNIRSVKLYNPLDQPTTENLDYVAQETHKIFNQDGLSNDEKQDLLLELFTDNLPPLDLDDEVDYYGLAD